MFYPDLSREPYLAYDTETTGLEPMLGARVYSFQLSLPSGGDFFYDIRVNPEARTWLNDQMKHYKGLVVCHNASFDYRLSHATGIHMPLKQMRCTCVQHTLINEHEMTFQLGHLSRKYCKTHKKDNDLYVALAGQFGGQATKGVQMKNISLATPDMMCYGVMRDYAKSDTRSTLELYEWQTRQIDAMKLHKILGFENKLTPYLVRTEMQGMRVNIDRAQQAVVTVSKEIDLAQAQLEALVGFPVNVNATEDVKRILRPEWRDGAWWSAQGEPLASTPKGAASMAAPVLKELSHPAAKQVLELRSLIKTRETFLFGHIIESEVGGRVYPTINQSKTDTGLGTGSGRLSISNPAMQQIPNRNLKIAAIIKDIFLPEEGHVWVDSDKAAFEVRTFFHHANVPKMTKMFQDNPETDAHQVVADLMNIPRKPPKGGGPSGKQMNLAMLYNQGQGSTADSLGLPWEWDRFIPEDAELDDKGEPIEIVYRKAGDEATRLIEKYHRHFPGVKELIKGCSKKALERGYLFTPHGRHLHLANKKLAYKMVAILSQATAADYNKENIMHVCDAIDDVEPEARFLLNVHDSYGTSVPEDSAYKLMKEVKHRIESDRGLRIPLILEVNKPGSTWWESVKAERWM